MLICPLCSNKYSDHDQPFKRHIDDFFYCECINCGSFKIPQTVWEDNFDDRPNNPNDIVKTCISYDVRQYSDAHESQGSNRFFLISQKYIDERRENFTLPNPAEQANNLIKFIGSELNKTIDEIESLPKNLYLKIGAKSPHYCGQIVKELFNRKDIVGIQSEAADTPFTVLLPNLSLSGWEKYEAEKKESFLEIMPS